MPYVNNQGARIYWDAQGEGDPILLIMGLGCASDMWHRTIPELSNNYRTILLDNRGIGRSDAPPGPYSISLMADDAAAVLEASAVETAHVFGLSMGGMIAQELVLRHPARVRSLILGATNCGGSNAVHAAPEVIDVLLARAHNNPVDAFWAIAPYIYDASTPRELIQEDLDMRSHAFPSRESYMAQLDAILNWESHSRLNSIKIPTLVIHGETDQLIPAANADLLATEIPDAKLIKLGKASHVFTTDRPQETTATIMSFLQNVS